MLTNNHTRWLRILLVLLLVLGATTACNVGEIIEQELDRLVQELIQTVQAWLQEQLYRLVEDLERTLANWWDDQQQEIVKNWDELVDAGQGFWVTLFPPPPVITTPSDGIVSPNGAISIAGTAMPGSRLALDRNDRFYGEVVVADDGSWRVNGVVLTKGENLFSASVKKRLFSSKTSNSVRIMYEGGELGNVPQMSPSIDSNLDPFSWMVELALERLEDEGAGFYPDRRGEYTKALRSGIRASQEDDQAHRFINPDMPLQFDKHILVVPIPQEATDEQVMEAIVKALESAILDKAVRYEFELQMTESYERIFEEWIIDNKGVRYTFEYARVDLSRTEVLHYFDARAMAKFRTRLGTEVVSGLLGAASEQVVKEAVKMGFALWATADADSQAQHYYDLAIRAWNHRGPQGEPLPWEDPFNNGFDGDMGFSFGTNEEWAMFYLGRSIFYAQGVADPYYTIPYYKPDADLYAFIAGKLASMTAERLAEKKMEAVFGKMIGGARPVTTIFVARELLEWMIAVGRYQDAIAVRDEHRPNFAAMVSGDRYDYPMPDGLKQLGALTDRVGYPFSGPADFMLHRYLEVNPLAIEERSSADSPERFDVLRLLDADAGSIAKWGSDDTSSLVQNIGEHASEYVHGGNFLQSDARVPEGFMIYGSPYFIREIYRCDVVDTPSSPCFDADMGQRLRLVWFDGTVVEGIVDYQPGEVEQARYMDGMGYTSHIPLQVIGLSNASYTAGYMDSFPFANISLISVVGDEPHMYAGFNPAAAIPPEATSDLVHSFSTVIVGLTGNKNGPQDLAEWDGAARIATDRLILGTLTAAHILQRFTYDASSYEAPPPIIIDPVEDIGFALASPATLHLYDRAGRHVGLNADGDIALEIAGARYFTNEETGQQFIVVHRANVRDNYRVQVIGTGSGTFDLDVFYGDLKQDKAVRLAYEDIPLTTDTLAELNLKVDDEHPLKIDRQGDGLIDSETLPSRILETDIVEFRHNANTGILITGILIFCLSALGGGALIWRRRRAPVPFICGDCGAVVQPGAKYCQRCGSLLGKGTAPSIPSCQHCGTMAKRQDARFCGRCGKSL